MRERIAEQFQIARAEGALRKVADGNDDAEEVIDMLCEEIEKVENPYPGDSSMSLFRKHEGFEEARQKILTLLRSEK